MISKILLAVAMLSLLACQPMPRPFASRPPQDLALLALPDRGGVVVPTVASAPRPVGEALADAVVAALRLQNIPAMRGTSGNRESFVLAGRIEESANSTRLVWELRDPTGARLGGASVPLDGVRIRVAAIDDATASALALASAGPIAALIQPDAPQERTPRVYVAGIQDAPGDAAIMLPAALRVALGDAGIEVLDIPSDDALTIRGRISLGEPQDGLQRVVVRWTVLGLAAEELGTIDQSNMVPAGSLDQRWAPVAPAIASGAVEGVSALIDALVVS